MTFFSRSPETNPFGKLTETLPKIRISEQTKTILEREACEAGMTLSEFIRMYLEIRAHGLATVESLHAGKIKSVVGM